MENNLSLAAFLKLLQAQVEYINNPKLQGLKTEIQRLRSDIEFEEKTFSNLTM